MSQLLINGVVLTTDAPPQCEALCRSEWHAEAEVLLPWRVPVAITPSTAEWHEYIAQPARYEPKCDTPEPATWVVMLLGLAGCALLAWMNSRRAK